MKTQKKPPSRGGLNKTEDKGKYIRQKDFRKCLRGVERRSRKKRERPADCFLYGRQGNRLHHRA
jgi:hypothetical protein